MNDLKLFNSTLELEPLVSPTPLEEEEEASLGIGMPSTTGLFCPLAGLFCLELRSLLTLVHISGPKPSTLHLNPYTLSLKPHPPTLNPKLNPRHKP